MDIYKTIYIIIEIYIVASHLKDTCAHFINQPLTLVNIKYTIQHLKLELQQTTSLISFEYYRDTNTHGPTIALINHTILYQINAQEEEEIDT